ncbi:hypothetical protein CVT25_002990 [Psilocybe cyanescens]|uniref:Uncharacterized protein n=1 Tax=Psilocybe cyanescens TaxID=93625 RepID=A0A409WMV6_PSICY|nr:hypothetical protein CVT25_002990 [Psilocybe cyanescens]
MGHGYNPGYRGGKGMACEENFRNIFILCVSLCVTTVAHIMACFMLIILKTDFQQLKPTGYTQCFGQCTLAICTTSITIVWIPFFAFETIILVLTVKKFFEDIKSCFERTESGMYKIRIQFGVGRSSVLAVVMRDELVYYFVFMAVCVGNLILDVLDPGNFFYGLAIGRALQSAVCSRMLLNLRGLLDSQKLHSQFVATTCHGTLLQLSSTSIPQWTDLDDDEIMERRRDEASY